jgi:CDP-glucose 4,6-dehydratase
MNISQKSFWENKKIFLTGHSGFKGSWLSIWLLNLGAKVKGFSLRPNTDPNLYQEAGLGHHFESDFGDIRDLETISNSIKKFNPDILIHMAAQPIVSQSYKNPVDTYSTNVMGTLNILEASKNCSNLKSILAITTDKCYENQETDKLYKEDDQLGGYDPYSSSKGCCEILISSYRRSFFNEMSSPGLASARAGNVLGGGDWAQNRLIPDILKSFEKEENVIVRNPQSIRPWQHVLEPLSGYLNLAEKLYLDSSKFSEPYNFGPREKDCKSVIDIVEKISELWGTSASWKIKEDNSFYESKSLKLDISKARRKLFWEPKWEISKALKRTVLWHKKWLNNRDAAEACIADIKKYNEQ